jgi:hypothetical protein
MQLDNPRDALQMVVKNDFKGTAGTQDNVML